MLSAICNITDLSSPVYKNILNIGTHPIYSNSDIHPGKNRKLAKNALYLNSYNHYFCILTFNFPSFAFKLKGAFELGDNIVACHS
ncbi:MAG: hypothetical protein L0956_07055, partial [Candidatus Mariimomonas ferrooxydans]